MKKILSIISIGIVFFSGLGAGVSALQETPLDQTLLLNEYDMVIIAPEMFSASIQPLINHKNSHGVQTFLKTIEEIYQEYPGCDQTEQIKYFIKDAFDNNKVSYLLLFGDISHVPIRKTALSWNFFGEIYVPDVITDLYYSDIYDSKDSFATWDTNQDGKFSEIRMIMNDNPYNENLEIIDIVEGNPDVMIGRLPCSTIGDVENIVNKIITYETTTYGSEWFHRLIVMGGDTFPSVGGISEGEVVTEHISSVLSDFNFTSIKLWASYHTFRPIKINSEISKGAGFVSFSGHGIEYGFLSSNYNSPLTIKYFLPYIIGIQNKQKYPIMYFDACSTGGLDFQILTMNIPCLAWSLIKKHDSGAIACIAATRTAFGGFVGNPLLAGASCMHAYFFEAYTPGISLGAMFIQAQQKYIETVVNKIIYDPLTIQEFTLLGDPSLKIGGYPS